VTPVSIDYPQSSAPNGAPRLEHSADPSVLKPCRHRASLAELTHDLKNPLAVIRAGTQLLDRQLSCPEPIGPAAVRDGLAQIDAASARLALLLGDLLDVVSSGAVDVATRDGAGTTISVRLPVTPPRATS
jgi:hypothetical protein